MPERLNLVRLSAFYDMKGEMNVKHCALAVVAMAVTVGFAGGIPKSVTKGAATAVPSFEGLPFVAEGEAAAIAIPNTGWGIDWQKDCPAGKDDDPGLRVEPTEVELRGKKVPAIRITCTGGNLSRCFPLAVLPFEIDFTEWNVLSFAAKIECPKGVYPTIGDTTPMIGWFSSTFLGLWDDFCVAADDGVTYPWARNRVHVTDFKNHDYPATRTADGFTEFRWDVLNEERTSYKGIVFDRVKNLCFQYDTGKIKPGQRVVITIADMKLVKGVHYRFDEPARYAKWLKRVADYRPDYSDSSAYLEPPEEGRLGMFSKVRLAKGGVAQAEIVVDVSDDIRLENFYSGERLKQQEIMQTRGHEFYQARAAAYELQKWLGELTGGADFPVVSAPTDADNAKIYLGAGFAKRHFPEDLAKLAANRAVDGFAVRVKDGDIYIFGTHPMGTMNGVHAFVENNSDLIWAMADDPDGTLFTVDPDLTAVWGDALELPAFIVRGWQGGSGDWRRRNRSNFPTGGGYDWSAKVQYGFALAGGHYLSPQYYDRSEGMQADFNPVFHGERQKTWQPSRTLCCLANPEFPRHAFSCLPCVQEMRASGQYNCVYGTDDNFGVCECETCTAPIRTTDGRMLTPDVDFQAYYSAWLYTYLNKMDDAIQKEVPGYMTSTYAYFFAATYPPIKVNKTISPLLCAYYRKAYNQPIYAPANQDWWKIYKDWAKHTNQLYLYDYYGLSMNDTPIAEVYQEDLKAQRSIGFLRSSTEGFGMNQYCGCGDDRWCMARIAWNPDQDVEELHRRFNRRAYREAAPWIDRYRGTIRRNWYKNFRMSEHLDEGHESFSMIRALGLDAELRGYLAEAQKAVKNPHSKVLVDRLVADYDWCVTTKNWWKEPFPSQKNPAKMPAEKPVQTAADVAFTNLIAQATALSKEGSWPAAKAKFLEAASDRLVDPKLRGNTLSRTLGRLVGDTLKVDAKEAMKIWEEVSDDGFKKAYGWSNTMAGSPVVNSLAEAFIARRQPEEAAKVFDIWINWDGNILPSGLRAGRFMRKIDFLRGKKVDVTPYLPGYLAALRDAAKNGATGPERGNAQMRLVREEMAKTSVDERLKGLFVVIGDRFMENYTRKAATLMIPEICTVDGKTDWARVSAETQKALAAGDWSDLWRNSYSRQNGTDIRLDALLEIVAKAEKAGEKQIAADLIVKGATILGYTKDATKESVDKGGPGIWEWSVKRGDKPFEKRLKKLDDAMVKLGVKRQ